MPKYEILAVGRVQGVGFRAFAQQIAHRMDVKGFVRNLPDGNVEVVAESDEATLEAFCSELRKGPPASVVEDLLIDKKQEMDYFAEFSVKH